MKKTMKAAVCRAFGQPLKIEEVAIPTLVPGRILVKVAACGIVRHAHCPVLIVKEAIEHFQPQNIFCAIDTDDRLKTIHHYPFKLGKQGLKKFLYVLTPNDSKVADGIRDWMGDFAKANELNDYDLTFREAKSVYEGVVNYAEETKADLIVLFAHGHTGLRHLISGSVAEDVLNHAKVPVLVMRM